MKERRWSQLKTSEMSGISKSTLSDYINCKTLINTGNVEKLAKAFNVKKSDIDPSFNLNNVMETQSNYSVHGFVRLPVVGRISCGDGEIAYEDIERYEETPASPIGSGFFILKITSKSMLTYILYDV